MKRILECGIVLVVVFSFGSVFAAQPLPNNRGAFNPSGDYHPLTRPANNSEQFIQFVLQVRRKSGRLIARGQVRGVRPWYRLTFVSVTETQLVFSTVKIRGTSYDFEGRFLGKGNFVSQWTGQGMVMLEGTLRKFMHGKRVMELNTPFLYYPGC